MTFFCKSIHPLLKNNILTTMESTRSTSNVHVDTFDSTVATVPVLVSSNVMTVSIIIIIIVMIAVISLYAYPLYKYIRIHILSQKRSRYSQSRQQETQRARKKVTFVGPFSSSANNNDNNNSMTFHVTTPVNDSSNNISIFASAKSVQENTFIHQTLVFNLEFMYIEQQLRLKDDCNDNDNDSTCMVTCNDSTPLEKSFEHYSNSDDDVTPNVPYSGISSSCNHPTCPSLQNKSAKNHKKISKSTIIPLSSIINISNTKTSSTPSTSTTISSSSFTSSTLFLTIDVTNNYIHDHNKDNNCNKNKDKSTATPTATSSSSLLLLSKPYYDLVHNQVTIDNWKTHDAIEIDSIKFNDENKKNYNGHCNDDDDEHTFDNDNQSDHEEYHMNNDDNDDNEQSSTIMSNDIFTKYSVGKVSTTSTTTNATITNNMNNHKSKSTQTKYIEYEFTFENSTQASLFQTYYLVCRSVGQDIKHMYHALELLHIDRLQPYEQQDEQQDEHINHDETKNCNLNVKDGNVNHNDESISFTTTPKMSVDFNTTSPYFGIQRFHNVGILWSDIQQCLGELPFIQQYDVQTTSDLDERRQNGLMELTKFINGKISTCIDHDNGNDGNHKDDNMSSSSSHDAQSSNTLKKEDIHQLQHKLYKDTQLKLGYLDFFKLFIPDSLIDGCTYSTPNTLEVGIDSHQLRIRQLQELVDTVATASMRVCTYVNARKVVQKGWKVNNDLIESSYKLTKRLVLDDNRLNVKHDTHVMNEYYEPLAGTDARCWLEESDRGDRKGLFLPQAFSLIDCQVLDYDSKDVEKNHTGRNYDDKTSLLPQNDPVRVLASLKDIIDNSPNSKFFVMSFFHENLQTVTILLFMKNIPEGADVEFDNCLEGLFLGNDDALKRIELSIQLGPKPRISFARLAYMKMKAFASQFCKDSVRRPFILWKDTQRMSFPGFNLSQHTKMRRFGGMKLTNDEAVKMPTNYIAVTCLIQMSFFHNYPKRILDPVAQASNVVDFLFKFEQCDRPVGVIRMVHVDLGRAKISGKDKCYEPSLGAWLNDSVRVHTRENKNAELDESENDDIEDENPDDVDVEVDALKDILSCITVPIRTSKNGVTMDAQVLSLMNDGDLRRHLIAVRSNLKEAALRIVQSAAWRGVTFPIDTQVCEIELRSNQCFCQGTDKKGNPVLYFRNMCEGIWRKDIDASILATLHRIESASQRIMKSNPDFQFTLIILMGKPFDTGESNRNDACRSSDENDIVHRHEDDSKSDKNNDPNSSYHVHTNLMLVLQLIEIVRKNYPERLAKVLIIPHGFEKLLGTQGLRRFVPANRTREKIEMLDKFDDLVKYVAKDELSVLVGGTLPLENPS